MEQLVKLDALVERADMSVVKWLLHQHKYDMDKGLSTAYETSVIIEYFRYYDGKKRNPNGTR